MPEVKSKLILKQMWKGHNMAMKVTIHTHFAYFQSKCFSFISLFVYILLYLYIFCYIVRVKSLDFPNSDNKGNGDVNTTFLHQIYGTSFGS